MKFVSLLSSGIDSPVATYLMAPKTKEMILLHADNRPYTDDIEIQNFIQIAKYLKKIIPCTITAYTVPHGKTLDAYQKERPDSKFTCIICKRMLLRYAEHIAIKNNAEAIIMGDSLGQVASQTLQNLRVVDQAIELPILRPLIGYDKEDAITIAKKIGTFDLSIKPSIGCLAVPKKPSTRAQISKIETEEQKINIENLTKEVVKNSKLIDLS
jgi:thiamine biosynthesis protein ThiI